MPSPAKQENEAALPMKTIEPISRPETLKEKAYEQIRKMLSSGELAISGLTSTTQLAETLKVSRTPVREALLQLVSEGFLKAVDGRGFIIRTFSEKEIQDFFEARRIIEIYVVEQLVGLLKPKDFLALEKALERMQALACNESSFAFLDADRDFHMYLVQSYNNQYLESITNQIRTHISILGNKAISGRQSLDRVLDEHQQILEALRMADKAKAVAAMDFHLTATEKRILQRMK
jgi:DNA-binding GntR family transcriptional regulator